MMTAITCSPHIATMRLSGAPVINAISGRSVGAGRGAGGVNREAEKLVGKMAAIACGVIVGDGLRLVIVAAAIGVTVTSSVGVASITGVEVGSGVAVEVDCGVSVGASVGVSVAREVAVGLGVNVPVVDCVGTFVAADVGVDVAADVGVAAADVAVGDGVLVVGVKSEVLTTCVYFEPRFKSSRYSTVIVCGSGASDK